MKEVRLNNGVMMPAIGFGVYQIPESDTERCVSDALEAGYRMIDTASSYFNEKQVGDALRCSGLRREDVFVRTALQRTAARGRVRNDQALGSGL